MLLHVNSLWQLQSPKMLSQRDWNSFGLVQLTLFVVQLNLLRRCFDNHTPTILCIRDRFRLSEYQLVQNCLAKIKYHLQASFRILHVHCSLNFLQNDECHRLTFPVNI